MRFNYSKVIAFIFLIFIGSFLVAKFSFSEEFSEFKYLSNSFYNFSLSYPENFLYHEETNFKKSDTKYGAYFYRKDELSSELDHLFPQFSILVIENLEKLSFSDWIQNKLDPILISGREEIVRADNQFLRLLQQGEIDHYIHLISDNNYIFMLSTPIYDDKDISIYSEILESFKLYYEQKLE